MAAEAKPGEVVIEGGNATIGAPLIRADIRATNQPQQDDDRDVEFTVEPSNEG